MWFIALTLNQLGGPVYLLYPTNKTPPQEKIYRAFLSMKELIFSYLCLRIFRKVSLGEGVHHFVDQSHHVVCNMRG